MSYWLDMLNDFIVWWCIISIMYLVYMATQYPGISIELICPDLIPKTFLLRLGVSVLAILRRIAVLTRKVLSNWYFSWPARDIERKSYRQKTQPYLTLASTFGKRPNLALSSPLWLRFDTRLLYKSCNPAQTRVTRGSPASHMHLDYPRVKWMIHLLFICRQLKQIICMQCANSSLHCSCPSTVGSFLLACI